MKAGSWKLEARSSVGVTMGVLLCVLMSGCSAGRLLQMACKKDPEMCRPDTVRRDTVIVMEKPTITVNVGDIVIEDLRDTTITFTSPDRVRMVLRAGRKGLESIDCICPPEKLHIREVHIPKPYPAPMTRKQKWRYRWQGVGMAAGAIVLALVAAVVGKIVK